MKHMYGGFFFLWKILAMSSKRKIIRFFISQSNVNNSLNYFLTSHVFLSSCNPRFRCLDFLQVYTITVFYSSCFFWIYLDKRLQIRCYLKFYQSIWNETKLCHLYVYYDLLIVWNFFIFWYHGHNSLKELTAIRWFHLNPTFLAHGVDSMASVSNLNTLNMKENPPDVNN